MKATQTRITEGMSMEQVIVTMGESCSGAISFLVELLWEENGIFEVTYLDNLEIYGEQIYLLWNDCCDRKMKKFHKTLKAFQDGEYTPEQILDRLNGPRKIKPFI